MVQRRAFAWFRFLLAVCLLAVVLLAVLAGVRLLAGGRGGTPAGAPAGLERLAAYGEGEGCVYAGFPRGERPLRLLRNSAYAAGYDEERRSPAWVAYRLSGDAQHFQYRRPAGFSTDDRTRARVRTEDFTGSGYDRGHLAPSYLLYSRYGTRAMEETFELSNICPQAPQLNRGRWNELEERIGGNHPGAPCWAVECGTVWVVAGPVYDAQPTYLQGRIEIPDAFFCIVLDMEEARAQLRALAFLLPNRADSRQPLPSFLVSVDAVEERTGLDFFPDLGDDLERPLERERAKALWN